MAPSRHSPRDRNLARRARRLEAHDVPVGRLADQPGVDQQVDVPDDLREREEGLGDRDVAPQLLGELVCGARALLDQPAQLLGPPPVQLEALVDERDVVGDRLAMAGEHDLGRQLARARQRAQVGDQRLRAYVGSVERSREQRVGGDVGDQVIGAEQDPALGVPEEGVGGAVAGPKLDLEHPVAKLQALSVGERPGHLRGGSPAAEAGRDAAQRGDHVLRDPVAEHEPGGERIVALGVGAVALHERRDDVDRGHLGAGARGEDLDQAEVVEVLMADHDQLEVLDRVAELARADAEAHRGTCRSSARCRPASAARRRAGSS